MAKAAFGRKEMAEIDSPTVLELLRKIEARGKYETTKRLRSRIGGVFRYAIASGVPCTDPTLALRDALIRPKVKHRAAIIDLDELGALMRAIDTYHGEMTTRYALQFLALVVQRPGEVRKARWQDFDLGQRIWSIPGSQMKMRRPHVVPLSPQALAVLGELRRFTGNGRFLFPS